jgi:hypothetical protein
MQVALCNGKSIIKYCMSNLHTVRPRKMCLFGVQMDRKVENVPNTNHVPMELNSAES